MSTVFKINWDIFKTKNENPTKAFEDLCYHLFCRHYHFYEGIHADFNQAGQETHPELIAVNNMNVGFQAKFFENDRNYYHQIKSSVEMGDKNTTIKLFNKFYDFCDLLLN